MSWQRTRYDDDDDDGDGYGGSPMEDGSISNARARAQARGNSIASSGSDLHRSSLMHAVDDSLKLELEELDEQNQDLLDRCKHFEHNAVDSEMFIQRLEEEMLYLEDEVYEAHAPREGNVPSITVFNADQHRPTSMCGASPTMKPTRTSSQKGDDLNESRYELTELKERLEFLTNDLADTGDEYAEAYALMADFEEECVQLGHELATVSTQHQRDSVVLSQHRSEISNLSDEMGILTFKYERAEQDAADHGGGMINEKRSSVVDNVLSNGVDMRAFRRRHSGSGDKVSSVPDVLFEELEERCHDEAAIAKRARQEANQREVKARAEADAAQEARAELERARKEFYDKTRIENSGGDAVNELDNLRASLERLGRDKAALLHEREAECKAAAAASEEAARTAADVARLGDLLKQQDAEKGLLRREAIEEKEARAADALARKQEQLEVTALRVKCERAEFERSSVADVELSEVGRLRLMASRAELTAKARMRREVTEEVVALRLKGNRFHEVVGVELKQARRKETEELSDMRYQCDRFQEEAEDEHIALNLELLELRRACQVLRAENSSTTGSDVELGVLLEAASLRSDTEIAELQAICWKLKREAGATKSTKGGQEVDAEAIEARAVATAEARVSDAHRAQVNTLEVRLARLAEVEEVQQAEHAAAPSKAALPSEDVAELAQRSKADIARGLKPPAPRERQTAASINSESELDAKKQRRANMRKLQAKHIADVVKGAQHEVEDEAAKSGQQPDPAESMSLFDKLAEVAMHVHEAAVETVDNMLLSEDSEEVRKGEEQIRANEMRKQESEEIDNAGKSACKMMAAGFTANAANKTRLRARRRQELGPTSTMNSRASSQPRASALPENLAESSSPRPE